MGKHKPPLDCYTCGDVDDCLDANGAPILRQNGSHIVRRFIDHTFVYPWHKRNQRLSPGVRNQLVKLMIAAGITGTILFAMYPGAIQPIIHLIGL